MQKVCVSVSSWNIDSGFINQIFIKQQRESGVNTNSESEKSQVTRHIKSLRRISKKERKTEASKPLYLVRYE